MKRSAKARRCVEAAAQWSSRARVSALACETGIAYSTIGSAAGIAALAIWVEGSPQFRPWPVLGLWVFSIYLLLLGARLLGAPAAPTPLRFERWEWLALGGITLVGALVRLVALSHVPGNFSGDEGQMGLEARAVLSGELRDPFTSGWLGHPTLWFYAQAGALRAFGNNVQGLRTLSALLGTATVPALYVFARKPFGRRVALAAASLLAVFHLHVQFSRIGLDNVAEPLVSLLGFTAFLEGCRRRSPFLFALAGVLIGIDQQLYFAGRLAPLLLAGVLVHMLLFRRPQFLAIRALIPLLVLGFFVGFGPLIRLPVLDWPDFNARLAVEGIFQSGWYHDHVASGASPFSVLGSQAWHGLGGFGFVTDRGPTYSTGSPLLDPVSNSLFIAGIVILVLRLRQSAATLVLLTLLATATASALVDDSPAGEHYLLAAPAMCLAIALGIDAIAGIARAIGRVPVIWRTASVTAAVVALGAWNLNFYFARYSPRNTYGFAPTETASAVARYLAARADPSYTYLLIPNLYLDNGTIRFLAPAARGVDGAETPPDQLPARPAGTTALFIMPPDSQELTNIRQLNPGGSVQTIRRAGTSIVLATVYAVPNPA